ncbi:carboxypeptidase regulatory-like domain-containing protein [Roseisolibacter sp. H3M3-2]|uniref:Kelch repeat-containing protein n=1 Tax=Roseisolibacter sp. H3M3-2 TaxID=3031323 RepID=UPI0023DC96D7|nr:carboxypeptidase regulatory-like domain-containing protein [Roseisolibacter sp. H3M3-2]MDF1503455.1 carboxypeptidase regulatory-like domain-containing protein [Roseisolibacter sp. H3M3-2]
MLTKHTIRTFAALAASLVLVACGGGGGDPTGSATATVAGVVKDAAGAVIAGASVSVGALTATTGADGRFALPGVPVGSALVVASAPDFDPRSQTVTLVAGSNTLDVVLAPADKGEWGTKANLLANNSEYALAEAGGKLYVLGGYPPQMGPNRTSRTVQVYDVAADRWELGPPLPEPNNHGMAAAVGGRVYLLGGQVTDDQNGLTAVNTVWELDPARGTWVEKAPMPTARSGGVAVALGGKIYVAGGRVPRGNDFAAYDPAADAWEVLPDLPSQRNHVAGAAIGGRVHVVGGRLGNGLSPVKSDAHEVYDPAARRWTAAAPMLRGRSGMNGAVARGCFHVWGGEAPTGMTPDHDYYDPRADRWASLRAMPIPIHGVVGAAYVGGLVWVTGGGTNVGGASGSLHNQTYKPAVSCE